MRWNGVGQEVRGGTFDVVENAMQMKGNHGAEFFGCGRFRTSYLFEIGDQAIESAVLAEKENFILAAEIVVKVSRGEVGCGGDFAHARFGKASRAEFAAGSAKDFESAGLVAALEAGATHENKMALGSIGVNRN